MKTMSETEVASIKGIVRSATALVINVGLVIRTHGSDGDDGDVGLSGLNRAIDDAMATADDLVDRVIEHSALFGGE